MKWILWRFLLRMSLVVLLGLVSPATAAETKPFYRDSYKSLVAAHVGQSLVVHFWSLTCMPCLVEMPRWGALVQKRPDLKLVMVSTDSIDDAPRIAGKLQHYGIGDVSSYAFADPFTERLNYEVAPDWRGEVPRTILVGRDGITETISGMVPEAFVIDWLDWQKDNDERRRGAAGGK
ncbi:MAG: TlpA family protein disulfide reductase [Alphaproteobacteria bacterium]